MRPVTTTPRSEFNPPIAPAAKKLTASWWLKPVSREQFMAEAISRHPSGSGGMYRRIE